jgi:hypothetical protein
MTPLQTEVMSFRQSRAKIANLTLSVTTEASFQTQLTHGGFADAGCQSCVEIVACTALRVLVHFPTSAKLIDGGPPCNHVFKASR